MSTSTAPATMPANLAGKYLTFNLDGESYGLPVQQIREIIRRQKITPVPQMPGWLKGVINLRGRVVPILDLRAKFDLPAELTERTCIIVSQVTLASCGSVQMGLIVDSVDEVVTMVAADIEPTPEFGGRVNTAYLLGMGKVKGHVKLLLNLERTLADEELASVNGAGRAIAYPNASIDDVSRSAD